MDWLYDLGVTVIITTLKNAVKNKALKKRIKAAMLKIRDMIMVLYPEEAFTAENAAKARKTLRAA